MTRELGWSRPNARQLNNGANELEKCVATDTTQIHVKMLRDQWTVRVLKGESSLLTPCCKIYGMFTFPFSSPCHPSSLVLSKTFLFNFLLFDYSVLVFPLWKYDQHAWECVVQTVGCRPSLILATETTVNCYIPLPLSPWTQTALKIMKLINDATRFLPNFALLRV